MPPPADRRTAAIPPLWKKPVTYAKLWAANESAPVNGVPCAIRTAHSPGPGRPNGAISAIAGPEQNTQKPG